MHIGDWLGHRAALSPRRIALRDATDGDRPVTYSEWNAAATSTAHLLRRLGVEQGERVAVLAMNCVAYLDVWFACGKLGAVLQNLNWRLTASELQRLLLDDPPRVLAYGPQFVQQVSSLRQHLPTTVFVALDSGTKAMADDPPLTAREDEPTTPLPTIDLRLDDPWVICYTGGTTGLPKGALLTHGNLTFNAINTISSWGLTAADTAILNAPLFHTGGLNVFTAPLVLAGGASVVCQGFNPDQVFDLLASGGVTLLFGVPTMFIALQQHQRWAEADFRGLKLVISGGAPCPMPVFEAFWERGVPFKTGYGLTEAGPNTFWLPPEDVQRKPGSVGVPLFFVETQIRGEGGQRCGADEIGELLIRGPHVCKGYWNRPEETARAISGDGWLHTGDLARCDDEGYYWIVGRSKDVIISGGENIYPAEVESVLAAHPAVAEAALIAVPDPKWGEVGRAIVTLHAEQPLTAEALSAFCAERLARYKVPRSVVFVAGLPKTAAGKVDKLVLEREHGAA